MTSSGAVTRKPPATIHVIYCPVCGRNDLVLPLKARHSSGGVRCEGVLKRAAYVLESCDA